MIARRRGAGIVIACAWLIPGVFASPGFRAGVARIDVTPQAPIWMAGYGSRTYPSTGVAQRLWAKALAIDDGRGGRAVIVTTDLIGLPHTITDFVAARALKEYGLDRPQLLFNSSHTHTGPMVSTVLQTMFELTPADAGVIDQYSRQLSEDLFTLIGAAMGREAPAKLSYGLGKAHFAVNRRERTPQGVVIGVNPTGPVDPDVPVLRVTAADGKMIAVLFGYACHNTTLNGSFYQLAGDYAGFAQADLEQQHSGVIAMFVQLCAGDQNPNPGGTLELAERHGRELAAEVDRVLSTKLSAVEAPIRSAFRTLELEFALHTRETFEKELRESKGAQARRARAMLKTYDDRQPIHHVSYPIQAIRFDKSLTILALGGEVVVDYSLRVKREYPGNLMVAGYSNDVMSYIPTSHVLKEGGYEAVESMFYYGMPGPYADDVEDRVMAGIHQVMKAVGITERQ